MKIRIRKNSIRFRLTRVEVEEFCKQGHYEEKTVFENATFRYGLRIIEHLETLSVDYASNTITIKVPKKLAENWNSNEKVGFENTVSLKNGNQLQLLLEKDFTCLDDRAEDESNNYPNPKMVG